MGLMNHESAQINQLCYLIVSKTFDSEGISNYSSIHRIINWKTDVIMPEKKDLDHKITSCAFETAETGALCLPLFDAVCIHCSK